LTEIKGIGLRKAEEFGFSGKEKVSVLVKRSLKTL